MAINQTEPQEAAEKQPTISIVSSNGAAITYNAFKFSMQRVHRKLRYLPFAEVSVVCKCVWRWTRRQTQVHAVTSATDSALDEVTVQLSEG